MTVYIYIRLNIVPAPYLAAGEKCCPGMEASRLLMKIPEMFPAQQYLPDVYNYQRFIIGMFITVYFTAVAYLSARYFQKQ